MINETWIRLSIFVGVLAIMMLWECLAPNRLSAVSSGRRWFSNFSMMLLGAIVARLILPTGLAAIAIYAQNHQLGLWNQFSVTVWISIPVTVVLLDGLIYWQHRLFHHFAVFWRFHKVHHADPHLDASSGLRFHPVEIALSLLIKAMAVLLLGAPIAAILIFEVLLNATSIFNHSNIKLPSKVESFLRTMIVTQAMHRIHHSQKPSETNSNFGFNLSCWDRIFGSYLAEAENADENIELGLKEYLSPETNSKFIPLLLMPFRKKSD